MLKLLFPPSSLGTRTEPSTPRGKQGLRKGVFKALYSQLAALNNRFQQIAPESRDMVSCGSWRNDDVSTSETLPRDRFF